MKKISQLTEFTKLYLFTVFSNISPNRKIKYFLYFFFKTAYYNLKYSYKNIFIPSNEFKFKFTKGNYWNRCINHLNFVGKYFDINKIHKAIVIENTVQNFTSQSDKNLNNDFFYNKNLINYSKYLTKFFKDVKYNNMLYWYGKCYHSFISNILSSKQIEITKNSHVLEIGPGLGLNSLFYSDFNSRDIYFFDLNSMILIQKKIENEIKKTKKLNNIIYNHDVSSLEKSLASKQFYIFSKHAFSEFPINLREKFENLVRLSKFSLFLSNTFFENVENEKYFKNLSYKINKKLTVKDFVYPNQDKFSKTHKYFIFHD